MHDPSDRDLLVEAVLQERDAALEEARFERHRAEQALARNEVLRAELTELRDRLRRSLSEGPATPAPLGHLPPPPGALPARDDGDLADRLRLAMDTNRRLERVRANLEKELEEAREALGVERGQVERLQQRARALEGQLRIARSGR